MGSIPIARSIIPAKTARLLASYLRFLRRGSLFWMQSDAKNELLSSEDVI